MFNAFNKYNEFTEEMALWMLDHPVLGVFVTAAAWMIGATASTTVIKMLMFKNK